MFKCRFTAFVIFFSYLPINGTNMKQSVAGIVRKNGKFLLGLREPGGEVGNCWEFPGGKCEEGETHEETLIREYDEELNIPISVGNLIDKQEFRSGKRAFDLFAYEVFIDKPECINSSVHTKIDWFTFDELTSLNLVPSDALLLPALQHFYRHQP